jgi:hypothetical protein
VQHRVRAVGVARAARVERVHHPLAIRAEHALDLVLDAGALGYLQRHVPQIGSVHAAQGLHRGQTEDEVSQVDLVRTTVEDEGGLASLDQGERAAGEEGLDLRALERLPADQLLDGQHGVSPPWP